MVCQFLWEDVTTRARVGAAIKALSGALSLSLFQELLELSQKCSQGAQMDKEGNFKQLEVSLSALSPEGGNGKSP